MKKTGFTLSLLILSIAAISQAKLPIVKGYAYLRESLPGIVPKTVDEKGNESYTRTSQSLPTSFSWNIKREIPLSR